MRDPGGVRLGTVDSFAQIASKQDGNGGLQEARCALDKAGCHSQPALCVCGAPWFGACITCTEGRGGGVQTEGEAAPQQARLSWLQEGMETEPHSY